MFDFDVALHKYTSKTLTFEIFKDEVNQSFLKNGDLKITWCLIKERFLQFLLYQDSVDRKEIVLFVY